MVIRYRDREAECSKLATIAGQALDDYEQGAATAAPIGAAMGGDELQPGLDAGFAQQIAHVDLCRGLGDGQQLRDLCWSDSLASAFGDLLFATGEAGRDDGLRQTVRGAGCACKSRGQQQIGPAFPVNSGTPGNARRRR